MKHIILASAAMLTLGIGSAFADGDVASQPAQAQAPRQVQGGVIESNGVFVSSSPRHEVWVYRAFRGNGTNVQGGEN
jgi:hypothetical protein